MIDHEDIFLNDNKLAADLIKEAIEIANSSSAWEAWRVFARCKACYYEEPYFIIFSRDFIKEVQVKYLPEEEAKSKMIDFAYKSIERALLPYN